MVNQAATQLSGYQRSEMIGQTWPYPWLTGLKPPDAGDPGRFSSTANPVHPRAATNGCEPWPRTELEQAGGISEFEAVCVDREGRAKTLGIT